MPGSKYGEGSHGAKKGEQKRLSQAFDLKVSGDSHQSEHPIGYEPISRGIEEKRGKGGVARDIENSAMAYQEVYQSHRAHVGTGMQKNTEMVKAFGLDSEQYRDAQRDLVKSGQVGDAIQLNQMGYAFDKRTSSTWTTKEGEAATDSFNHMIVNQDEIKYHDGGKNEVAEFSYEQKFEAFASRKVVAKRSNPSSIDLESYEDEFKSLLAKRAAREWEGKADPMTGEIYPGGKKKAAVKRKRTASAKDASAADPFSLDETKEENPRKRVRRKAPKPDDGGSDEVKEAPAARPVLKAKRRLPSARSRAKPPSGDEAFKIPSASPSADPASGALSLKPSTPPRPKSAAPSPFAMEEAVPSETPTVTEAAAFVPMDE